MRWLRRLRGLENGESRPDHAGVGTREQERGAEAEVRDAVTMRTWNALDEAVESKAA